MTSLKVKDKSGCTMNLMELDGKLFPEFPVETLRTYRSLPLREDDVILCAYPKSGTHWLWEVMMMLVQGKAETITFKKSMQMIEFNSAANMAEMTSPRVLNTHVHYDDLPRDAHKLKTKLVFVARNPKDVAVSLYNHHRKLTQYYQYSGSFGDWLNLFLEGKVDFGSWFDYMSSWEKVLFSDDSNPIHILMYEDMKENPVSETKRLAEFLGVPSDPALMEQVAAKCDFSRMAQDKRPHQDHSEVMFRKGQVGDWKNTFTVAQSEALDAMFAERMKGSKLKFRYTL